MNPKASTQVYITFFKVASAQEKQAKLIEIAHHHFSNAHPLLFFSKDKTALDYVSWLLWSFSKNDFLPHSTDLKTSEALLYLGASLPKHPQTPSIFNLTLSPIALNSITNVYEFDDSSTEDKVLHTKKRYAHYLDKKFALQLQ